MRFNLTKYEKISPKQQLTAHVVTEKGKKFKCEHFEKTANSLLAYRTTNGPV